MPAAPDFITLESTHLFVGGCADGRRLSVPRGVQRYFIPKPIDHGSVEELAPYRSEDTYVPATFCGDGQDVVIYAIEGMTGLQVLQMLVNRYPANP